MNHFFWGALIILENIRSFNSTDIFYICAFKTYRHKNPPQTHEKECKLYYSSYIDYPDGPILLDFGNVQGTSWKMANHYATGFREINHG